MTVKKRAIEKKPDEVNVPQQLPEEQQESLAIMKLKTQVYNLIGRKENLQMQIEQIQQQINQMNQQIIQTIQEERKEAK